MHLAMSAQSLGCVAPSASGHLVNCALCVQLGLAPQLLAEHMHEGRLHLIEMEYLCKEDGWYSLADPPATCDRAPLKQLLTNALQGFRGQAAPSRVHGDLRPPNIMVRFR